MDKIFKALADSSRRKLLDHLRRKNGQKLAELCLDLDMTRQAVSKHLKILEEANLVVTQWQGREKHHFLNAVPIHEISNRWINKFDQHYLEVLSDIKTQIEDKGDKNE